MVAVAVVAAGVVVPAHANDAAPPCPGEGTVPGTERQTFAVPVGDRTFYIDDRGQGDVDGGDDNYGIWVYEETNGKAGLQEGASRVWWQEGLPERHEIPPYIPPTTVLPSDPNRPVLPGGYTSPGLFDGHAWEPPLWWGDNCGRYPRGPVVPDRLWF